MRDTCILIVEDEGLIALDLKKKLEQVGYTVPAIADNAIDALLAESVAVQATPSTVPV